MATDKEFVVNRKFLIIFVAVQIVIAFCVLYALLSPKSITVHVQQNNSYDTNVPLSVKVPLLK